MASSDEYLDFRMATVEDAGLLVDLYNASFSAIINDSVHARDMEKRSR